MPDNWCYISIEDLNIYKSHSVNPADAPQCTYDLYSVPIYPTGRPEQIKGNDIGSTKQVVKIGDILLCKINPHLNRVWLIENYTENIQIASSEWIVVRSTGLYAPYLRAYFTSPSFRELLCSQVSGVGGSLTRAQPAVVKKYLIAIPPYNEQVRIANKIVELSSKIEVIESNLMN